MATIDDYGNPTDPANSPSVSAWAAAVRAELVALRGDVDAAPQVVFDTDPPTGTPAQAGIVWGVVPSGTTATALYMSTATDWIEIPIGGGTPTPDPETLFDPTDTGWADLTGANALGTKFLVLSDCTLSAVRLYPRHTSDVPVRIYTAAGTLLTSQTVTGLTADTWQEIALTSPQALTAGQSYVIAADTGTPTRTYSPWSSMPLAAGNSLVLATNGLYTSPGNFPNNDIGNGYCIDGLFEVV